MELEFLLALGFGDIPWWVWGGALFLAVIVLFGDSGLWDYEVKFPRTDGVGRGEVEFEAYKRRGTTIEARFELEPGASGQPIDIYLNHTFVLSIDADRNKGGRVYFNEPVPYDEPKEGDVVTVLIGGQEVFRGLLVLD